MPSGIPDVKINDDFWADRFADINAFERHLTRNGTVILKFFLHISKDEQRKRLIKRLKDPKKHWKFSAADIAERAFWNDYMKAYEEAISATSTKWAPWHIIPADHKWVSRALVSRFMTTAIESLDLQYPDVSDAQRAAIAEAKKQLEAEKGALIQPEQGELPEVIPTLTASQYAASSRPSAPTWYGIQANTTRSTVMSVFLGRMGNGSKTSASGRSAASSFSISSWNLACSSVYFCRNDSSDPAAWLAPSRCCAARLAALAAVAARETLVLLTAFRPSNAPRTELPIAMVASQEDRLAWACSRSSRSLARRI